MLLHNHSLGNVKEELLTGMVHTAIALFAVFAALVALVGTAGLWARKIYCRLGLAGMSGVYRAAFVELSRSMNDSCKPMVL